MDPDSVIPTLGASGAISGVLGAYLVMFPANRVTVFLIRAVVPVPAVVAIGMWFALQVFSGFFASGGGGRRRVHGAHRRLPGRSRGGPRLPDDLQRATPAAGPARLGVR